MKIRENDRKLYLLSVVPRSAEREAAPAQPDFQRNRQPFLTCMKFGTGQSWESQSTPQMKMQAAKDFAHPPPAITRKVKRSLHDIEYLIDHAMDQADLQIEIIRDALAEAYVSQVWRESDATSFADWIFRKWGKSKSWGYRMIQEHVKQTFPEVENCVSTNADTQPVTNEPEEDEKPSVRAATPEQMKRKPEPEPEPLSTKPPMDASGAIIPQHLLAMRERRDEITALETAASKLRALFERLQTDPDMIYGHILASGNVQHFERSASSIRHNLAECLPDIVCPRCEGSQNGKPCEYCCGSGWIAEVRWNREWVKSNGSMEKAYVAKRAKNL